ncbi:hypothetical protein ACFSSA_06820 [Luteolibacter algae]|uniref:Uncharacterized protein n=1 Tax=Luteolibacter algae TaxID=454151 RepID=A0ABW5D717_9BACT
MIFVTAHKVILKRAALVSGLAALGLTVLNFPLSVYAYLLVGGILVLGFFALALFSGKEDNEISYAKHSLAGVAFAYGTALMAHVYLPNLGIRELLFSREFICFSLLCIITSTATEIWAHGSNASGQSTSVLDEITISLPLTLLGAAALISAVQNETMAARPFFYAILTGAALLQVLNRTRSRFGITTVKLLSAVCLLVPGLIFQAYLRSQ